MTLHRSRSRRKPNPKRNRAQRKTSPKASRGGRRSRVTIRLRDQHQRADEAREYYGNNPARVFRRVLDADVAALPFPVIEVVEGDVTMLDLDTHQVEQKPTAQELEAWAEAAAPAPDVWWSTHGSGLRLVYFGRDCEKRALAAALSVPQGFDVEIKRDSRHPRGAHPDRPGATCGPAHFAKATRPRGSVNWLAAGRLDDKAVEKLLAERGMRRGGRYAHELCPIDGRTESSAGDCVVALGGGIYCHRCAAKGLYLGSCGTPGLAPYAQLASDAIRATVLQDLARHFVHWAHARVHLRSVYPNLAERLVQQAYNLALTAAHSQSDPRISLVFNADLRLLQGESTWYDSDGLKELRVTKATLNSLPGLLRIVKGTDGDALKVRAPLLDRANSGLPLDGYKPVRVERGIVLRADDAVLQMVVPPPGDPIELLRGDRLLPESQAIQELSQSFPGISRSYLLASLAAAICASRGGRPPMIMAVGPTGSGKGETIRLAASFLGDERVALALEREDEKNWRRIGAAIELGARFLFFDEILRRGPQLRGLIALVLQLSSRVTWRRLYANADVQTTNRAGYFLAAGCVPDGFKKSPELRRRMWLARLERQTPDWERTSGGDTAAWRARSKRNAEVANSMLTHAFQLCADRDFNFDNVAAALGLCRIDEGEADLQRGVLRDLYRHCRNHYGNRLLHASPRYAAGRWVNALGKPCQDLLQQLVPDEDSSNPDPADMVFQLQQNLQMTPWNDVLGIDEPPIRFELRRRGGLIAIRFREGGCHLRGRERINEDLPPIPGDDSDGPCGSGASPNPPGPRPLWSLGPPACHNGEPTGEARNGKNARNGAGSACSARSGSFPDKSRRIQKAVREDEAGDREAGSLPELPQRTGMPAIGAGGRWAAAHSPASPPAPHTTTVRAAGGNPVAAGLSAAGFPDWLLVLDFESYFDAAYSLQKLTIPEYVHDARFFVHGLAIRRPSGGCEFRDDVEDALKELRGEFGERLERVTVAAHNTLFDGYVLAKRFDLRPAHLTDTLAMARHVFPRAENGLAALAERFGLPPKGATLCELKGVRELSVVQAAEFATYAKRDAQLCFDIACRLLPRISRPEVELRLIDHTIRLFTERALPFNTRGAKRLLTKGRKLLDKELKAAKVDRKAAGGAEKFHSK